ncbi:G5 domain-containing protein [Actinomadura sp. 3N407]|uniref:G5 domain-containing protein n=1 Tax=Actinomadura sp. 3N407 TaxID=3457423 RepID=UPI003FCDE085
MRHLVLAIAAISTLLTLGACAEQAEPAAANATASTTPSTASAPPTTSAAPTPTPSVEQRTVTETRKIPYKTSRVNDPTLAQGTTKVKKRGVAGVKTLTYEVTYTEGEETDRKLSREVVTRKPVTRIIAVGTKQARQCDPNYSGACVPIASDVDCAGGSGNGPAYVQGPVRVVGSDIYDLDRDGDGTACDS